MFGCGFVLVFFVLFEWYCSVGLNIIEVWGMMEFFVYSIFNYLFCVDKIGIVGNVGLGIELKIVEDEEILVCSKGLFVGYYKNDIVIVESFNDDGWLYIGDIGLLDSEGYLII